MEEIKAGVEFARSLIEKGYLSNGEFNAIVSAQNRLKEGNSSEAENTLLAKWAGKARWEKGYEQMDDKVSQFVIKEVGRETFDYAESYAHAIKVSIKTHLGKVKNPADVERVADLWRHFSDLVFGQIQSANGNLKKVETALELAIAILEFEPTIKAEAYAKKGVVALKRRFGNSI